MSKGDVDDYGTNMQFIYVPFNHVQTIDTLGADDTSYVDNSIPYNDDGDANLVYQVMSVGSSSDPAGASASASAAPPASQPTRSPQVDCALVSVTSIKIARDPLPGSYNHYAGNE
jgi:hypothetical protein